MSTKCRKSFPVDYQDILEDAAWEEAAGRTLSKLNEARTPIYTTRDLGTVDLYVSTKRWTRITPRSRTLPLWLGP